MRNIARAVLEEHRDFVDARPLVDVEGLSSPKVCNFLNRLVARLDEGACYLEVGTFKGLTLISAALGNRGRQCVGCDKFRLYGRFTGFGPFAKRALLRNVARYRQGSASIEIHHTTSRNLFAEQRILQPVGVYFYDGDHSFAGTHHGMVAAAPYLAERAIVLVDDWSDPVIRGATREGLRQAGLRCLWERELEGDHSVDNWWNGLGVFFVEKEAQN